MDLNNSKEMAAAILLAGRVETLATALDLGMGVMLPEAAAMEVAEELGYAADRSGIADLAIHHDAVISRVPGGILLVPAAVES